jgi:DNA invertase Pin-like site-specific DNA recombinase
MTTAAVYIRKSREDKESPAYRLTVQREQLPAYAVSQGWQPIIYDDGYASAAHGKTENLHERARMEADIRAGKIDLILTIELSRLSRDDTLEDYLSWLNLCGEHGVCLSTMSRILDPRQHSDWMLLLMEGGFSSVEMRRLRERMEEGRAEAYREGKWLGGTPPPPYVYDHATGQICVDEGRLEHCRRIWAMAENRSAKSVAEEQGLAEITVRRMLSDDRLLFYQGLRKTPAGEILAGQWPAVMDQDQAERIRMARRTRRNGPEERRPHAALLSNLGLLVCGYCGRTVKTWYNSRTRNDGTRLDYYGCQVKNSAGECPRSRLIPQPVLEERVIENVFNTLSRLDDLIDYWGSHQTGDITTQLKQFNAEAAAVKEQKERLVAAIAAGVIEFADAKKQREALVAKLDDIGAKRQDLISSRQDPPDWEALRSISRETFLLESDQKQRRFLKGVLSEVRVFSTYALLAYAFPREPDGNRIARIHFPPPQRGRRRSATNRNQPK